MQGVGYKKYKKGGNLGGDASKLVSLQSSKEGLERKTIMKGGDNHSTVEHDRTSDMDKEEFDLLVKAVSDKVMKDVVEKIVRSLDTGIQDAFVSVPTAAEAIVPDLISE
jgi:ATP-dependent DNA ligase